MNTLDNFKKISSLDSSSVLETASLLPDQIRQAWEEIWQLKLNLEKFKKVKNIIVVGMGGSALGARIIDSLSFEVLKVPLEIINGYHLPAYTDEHSLVVVSSYSGNTEETLSCYQEAKKSRALVFVISSGGKLTELARKNNDTAYLLRTPFNPSGQPRMGLGYSITAQLAFLSRCGLIKVNEQQISEVINFLRERKEEFAPHVPTKDNLAKKLALALENKAIVLISSEHLNGAAHAFKNMINENAKTFSVMFDLPEMNHHLLEGLSFPKDNQDYLSFLFLESSIYDQEIKTRMKITQEVARKKNISYEVLELKGRTRLAQAFEIIYLGGFLSSYLAFVNEIDPGPIPWVDFFKKRLKD